MTNETSHIIVGRKSGTLAWRVFLGVVLLMNFRTFQFFPGMLYVQELWFVLCFVGVLLIYPMWKASMGWRFSYFEVYLLLLTLVAILLPSLGAWRQFGQPIGYGVLSQRGVTLMASWLLLVNAMRQHRVRLADIEAVLLWLAWGTCVLYFIMKLILHPAQFEAYGIGFVSGPGEEATFKLSETFILFGVLYYALRGLREQKPKYYMLAAVLLPGAVVSSNGRSLLISLGMTLLIFLYRWRRIGQYLLTIGKFCCVVAIVIGFISVINPEVLSKHVASFSDAFRVVFTGKEVDDVSANARILETVLALPYIESNPLLGNGAISTQWKGGSEGVLGDYFHASDIGVIGVMFCYGLIGTALFAYQYRFAWCAARALPRRMHTPLLDATKAFLLYTALNSLTTGTFAFHPEVPLFFIALVIGIALQTRPGGQLSNTTGLPCTARIFVSLL